MRLSILLICGRPSAHRCVKDHLMGYFTLLIGFLFSAIALNRIFKERYHWLAKLGYIALVLIPIVGPIFYLLIDTPVSTPPGVPPAEFHKSGGKGAGDVVPSYNRLFKSLSYWFKYFK